MRKFNSLIVALFALFVTTAGFAYTNICGNMIPKAAHINQHYSFDIRTCFSPEPASLNVTGQIPAGLTYDVNSQTLTGTPSKQTTTIYPLNVQIPGYQPLPMGLKLEP